MPKNVVICCDGTGNEIATALTNVFRLFHVLVHNSQDQVSFYLPGVGTMEAPGVVTPAGRRISMIAAQSTGLEVYVNAERVISFVMRNYREGDRLFLFGFSRGAYTLQIVAALLHMWGLFREGTEYVVPYAIKFSRSIVGAENRVQQQHLKSAELFRQTFSRCDCPVHFIGMWDSVGSVGGPLSNPVGMPYLPFNPSIQTGRHAVAIDERRAFFGTQLWHRPDVALGVQVPDIKQVWFPGAHSDVGGGYPEAQSALAKISLRWMIEEATAKGLLVDENRAATVLGMRGGGYTRPDPDGPLHNSLVSFWKFAEFLPMRYWSTEFGYMWRIHRFRRRTIPPYSLVHVSAYQRYANYADRLPPDAVRVD